MVLGGTRSVEPALVVAWWYLVGAGRYWLILGGTGSEQGGSGRGEICPTNDMEGGVVQLCHSAHLVMKVCGQVGQLDIFAFELQKNKRREEGVGCGVCVGVIAGTSRRFANFALLS